MICEFCQNEMDTAESCVGNHTALFPDGERLPTLPYAHPTDENARCGDCGVAVGGNHHPGCLRERCPRCYGQRDGCPCGSTVASDITPLIERYKKLSAEQVLLERVFNVDNLIARYLALVDEDEGEGDYTADVIEAARWVNDLVVVNWSFVGDTIVVVYGYRNEYGDECDNTFAMPLVYLTHAGALPALRAEVEARKTQREAAHAAQLERERLAQLTVEESDRAMRRAQWETLCREFGPGPAAVTLSQREAQLAEAMLGTLADDTPGARLMRQTIQGWLKPA